MYATSTELKQRIGDVYAALYTAADGSSMDAEMAADLAAASAEIDGLIGLRYETPVTAVSALPLLKSWTLTLAEELAWVRSGKSDLTENLKARIAYVRGLLDKIASGRMRLPGLAESASAGTMLIAKADDPVFTRDEMEGY